MTHRTPRADDVYQSSGPDRAWWMFAAPVALLAALVMSIRLNDQLWDDEYITTYITKLSFHQLVDMVLHHVDAVHALYYAGIIAWTDVFGGSEVSLRIPSVIGMAVAAGAVTVIGARLLDQWAGLAGGLIFAALPSVSDFGQWARSYAWVVALACLGTIALLSALERPTTRRWVLYGVLTLLMIYLHIASAMILLPHAVLVYTAWRREGGRLLRSWLWAVAVVTFLTVPLLLVASRQTAQVAYLHSADWDYATYYVRTFFGSALVAWVMLALAFVGAVRLMLSRPSTAAVLLVWALVPSLLSYVTVTFLHMFWATYQLFTLPAWTLLAASAVIPVNAAVARRWPSGVQFAGAIAIAAVIACIGIPAQRDDRRSPHPGYPDYRAAAALVDAQFRSGDGIAYSGTLWPEGRIPFAYYLESAAPKDVFVEVSSQVRASFSSKFCDDAVVCLGDTQRVWLIDAAPKAGQDEYAGLPENEAVALKQLFTPVETHALANMRVVLLDRN